MDRYGNSTTGQCFRSTDVGWCTAVCCCPSGRSDHALLTAMYRPANSQILCKNCSINGSIDIFSGSFSMSSTNASSNQTEGIIDFFFMNNGYVELLVNDFSAHIELESKIKPSDNLITYTAPLPTINFSPFQVGILLRSVCYAWLILQRYPGSQLLVLN